MKKILLAAGMICLSFYANAQCTTVSTLDEDFNAFTTDDLPQNCWSAIANGPMVYIDGNDDGTDKYATFYSFTSPNVPGYLITPQIAASSDDYALSFDSFKIGSGEVTIQLGTISNIEDQNTFSAIGEVIALSNQPGTHVVELPAFPTDAHIAFKILANGVHHAAVIDNVNLVILLGTTSPVSETAFSIYPNPSADKVVTLNYNNNSAENATVSVYSLTGAKVFETALKSNNNTLDLSLLNSGVYIVKAESGNIVKTTKLVLQ